LPAAGHKVTANGLEFTVEKVTGQRIERIKVTKLPAKEKSSRKSS
jgi:CBS domain containing-hemolysin-like protein